MFRLLTILLLLVSACVGLAQESQPAKSDPKLTALDKKELAELAKTEKLYLAAKESYKKSPNDAAGKTRYVKATLKLANDTLVSPALISKVKYPKALRLYREVLVADPHNREAFKNKQMIVDIYRSLGKPVPKAAN